MATDKVTPYLTRWQPSGQDRPLSFDFEAAHPSPANSFDWSYCFKDGSCLVGRVTGNLDRESGTLLNPTQLEAAYLDGDGQTVLASWQDSDFACFEVAVDGSELVIVASSDRFVSNSMCLVSSPNRSRAQVTDWGVQLIGEPFAPAAWSLLPTPAPVPFSPSFLRVNLAFSPWSGLLSATVNFCPQSKTVYQWSFFPYFPFLASAFFNSFSCNIL